VDGRGTGKDEGGIQMDKRRTLRICGIISAIATSVNTVALIVVAVSAMCIVHGNIKALVPFAICLAVVIVTSGLADAADRRRE
jgi:hypothetical protein